MGENITRIVSVCIEGKPSESPRDNERRVALLAKVIRVIRRVGWSELDAVLFPAGYFRFRSWLGPELTANREAKLSEADFTRGCQRSAKRLAKTSAGCLIVVGVDTRGPKQRWSGDQLMVAYGESGVVGSARKFFTVDGDTSGDERPPYLVFAADAEDAHRIVRLPNGTRAALDVCYDVFVHAELALGPTKKRRALRHLADERGRGVAADLARVDALLSRHDGLLRRLGPAVHLVAVHRFKRPGVEIYFQRHGIATASAARAGSLVVAASHFKILPEADRAPLAASRVPRAHLSAAGNRLAREHRPVDSFVTSLKSNEGMRALVRLFECQ